jgi:hypothetical protein
LSLIQLTRRPLDDAALQQQQGSALITHDVPDIRPATHKGHAKLAARRAQGFRL